LKGKLILSPHVGKVAEIFGCSGEAQEDGMIDSIGGSEDVAKWTMDPALVFKANKVLR